MVNQDMALGYIQAMKEIIESLHVDEAFHLTCNYVQFQTESGDGDY